MRGLGSRRGLRHADRRRRIALVVASLLGLATGAWGDEAVRKVREGIERFGQGAFEEAAKAFAEADVARPEDPTIAFDQACALAAVRDWEKAISLFEQAALSRDHALAVRARYNLGSVASTRAKEVFSDHPENAPPEVREEGLSLLGAAIGHFRDCLELDPDHEDARHNLEVLRLWIKHMEALWAEQDREKRRDEMSLLELLTYIEGEERRLRLVQRGLADQPDSPRRRQALTEAEAAQRTLAQEIEPLKEKITEALQKPAAPGGAAGAAPPPASPPGAMTDEQREQALKVLHGWADEARQAMERASDSLGGGSLTEADQAQKDVLDRLDRLFLSIAPFAMTLRKALERQGQLVEGSAALVEGAEAEEGGSVEFELLSEDQDQVGGWGEALPLKAEREIEGLSAMDPSALAGQGGGEEAGKALEGLRTAMEKAIELAPRIPPLSEEAAARLREEEVGEALPKQEEVLKLLREIAESLPKQEQNQEGEQGGEPEPSEGQGQQEPQPRSEDRESRNLSREQAEALLRQARERERQHREQLKEQERALLRGARKVDRDW